MINITNAWGKKRNKCPKVFHTEGAFLSISNNFCENFLSEQLGTNTSKKFSWNISTERKTKFYFLICKADVKIAPYLLSRSCVVLFLTLNFWIWWLFLKAKNFLSFVKINIFLQENWENPRIVLIYCFGLFKSLLKSIW